MESDFTEQRLGEYRELVRDTLAKAPFSWLAARDVYGTFGDWFRQFSESTKGIKATELAGS